MSDAPIVPVEQCRPIGKLVAALAAAQKEYRPIKRGTENIVYSTDKRRAMYAELCDVIAATQPALSKHGLVVIQTARTNFEHKSVIITTGLLHESGESLESHLEIPASQRVKRWNDEAKKNEMFEKFDAQTIGAANTYGRRYEYQGIVGVSSEPDDDGNSLLEPGSKEAAQEVAQRKIAELRQKAAGATQSSPQPSTATTPAKIAPSPTAAPKKADLEAIGDVIKGFLRHKGVQEKLTRGKQKYLTVDAILETGEEITMQAFDNKQYPDGSSLFTLLSMASEISSKVPVRFRVKRNDKYVNIIAPELILNTEFDSDGIPVIQREEAPPHTDADFMATDEDLPENMR